MDYPRHGVPPRGRWLVLLALGSVASAVLLGMIALSTGRGTRALEKIAKAFRKTEVKIEERVVDREVTREVTREVEVPVGGTQGNDRAGDSYDARTLYNGIRLKAIVDKQQGGAASKERVDEDSFAVSLTLSVRAPKPVTTLERLTATENSLPTILPGLADMMTQAKVSPYFEKLYANKEARLQRDLYELNRLLSRHNYFDCETFLELKHPESGRKVLLLQAEMDVVSDGSDGDRLPEMPKEIVESAFYQPTTSYGWPKKTDVANPLIAGIENRLKKAKEEYAVKGLSAERNRELKSSIDTATATIADLKRRSFLIAEYDPFMVLPVFIITDRSATDYAARVGDYAVIIHNGRVFPAILGDAGPDFKVGEASLRIGKEIDSRTNPYRRPINDLKATYLVFPGTAEEVKTAPDLAAMHARCLALLGEIGGLGEGTKLHVWEDILARMAAEREAKRKAEEEAKRKAEEEARLKAEAEKLRAEEEAKRKAAEAAAQGTTPSAPDSPVAPPP
ncbi:MAG: glycoside hydrolase family 75 protein [Verrucomicrobiales bacterium]